MIDEVAAGTFLQHTKTGINRINSRFIREILQVDGQVFPAAALAKSVGRLPEGPVTPADLDRDKPARIPASPIGAALDLLKAFENGTDRPRETILESH